jgi:predicted nicotinamide N-methyase
MPRAQTLLHRIHRRGYETVSQIVQLPGVTLPFLRIADADRVLDQVAAEEDRLEKISGRRIGSDQLRLPYWAELWDSALAISQILCRGGWGQSVENVSVLDLGCGMGLTGTVAARLGLNVLFADLEPDALLFAQLNSLPDAARIRLRQLDWRKDRLDETFDLIIGADILYERKQWDYLEPFWRAHLKPDGQVLLGEPGRQTGDLFLDWIAARDWQVELTNESVTTRERPIRLLTLRPKTKTPRT